MEFSFKRFQGQKGGGERVEGGRVYVYVFMFARAFVPTFETAIAINPRKNPLSPDKPGTSLFLLLLWIRHRGLAFFEEKEVSSIEMPRV